MSFKPDVVVTTISKILPPHVLALDTKFINLHYSLLPAYAGFIGMKPVRLNRQNGKVLLGATCHEVVEEVDAGFVLSQAAAVAGENESEDIQLVFDIAWRVLVNGIHRALNEEPPFSGVEVINKKAVLIS